MKRPNVLGGRLGARGNPACVWFVKMENRLLRLRSHPSGNVEVEIDYGQGRDGELIFVIPCPSQHNVDWARVFPTVLSSTRPHGFSFLSGAAFAEPFAIVGWEQRGQRRFVRCRLFHCTPLGNGAYRVRLTVDHLLSVDPRDFEQITIALASRANSRLSELRSY
jgi:hypothetical protein